MSKELIVVGGPNGSGKTTFANEYASRHCCTYISADAVAAELRPDNPMLAQLAAGREVLDRINKALAGAGSFVAESTLAGRTFQHVFRDARNAGFTITVVYPLADHWVLIYNAGSQPQDVAVGTATNMSIRDAEHYTEFQRLIQDG